MIDIPHADSVGEGLRTIPANGRLIKKIRTRLDDSTGTLRIVLDLAPEENYKVDQFFFEAANAYVIEVGRESDVEQE